jgi:hypothetical protein
MLIERLAIWCSIAFIAGIISMALYSILIDGPRHQAEMTARCAAAGWSYSRQTAMRGKTPVGWDYCIDTEGYLREIP